MKVSITKGQSIVLVIVLVTLITVTNWKDHFSLQRSQLEDFVNASFKSDNICKVNENQYEDGKGYYTLFKVPRYPNTRFPVLLDKNELSEYYDYFEEGTIISKDSLSRELVIHGGTFEGSYHIIFQDPKDESAPFLNYIFIIFGIGIIFIVVIIPNSFWGELFKY